MTAELIAYMDATDAHYTALFRGDAIVPPVPLHSPNHTHHLQVCPTDATPLTCDECHIGGGSHYWSLSCSACGTAFNFDTYRFTLELA